MGRRGGESIILIDLLRFACAMLVLAYHFGTAFGHGASPNLRGMAEIATLPPGWKQWTWFGWVGVELFFVISGYVITGSAEGAAPGAFLWRRAKRLVPGALACATVTAILLMLAGAAIGPLIFEWWKSVLFVPVAPWIDPSYWTLGMEAAFYLLVAGHLCLRGGSGRIEWLGWALAAVCLAFWTALLFHDLPARSGLQRLPQLLLLTHGSCFALGIFARAASRRGTSMARNAGIALALAGAAIEIAAKSIGERHGLGVTGPVWVPGAIFALGAALVFAAHRLQPWFVRLPAGWAPAAGLATYPLYLLHQDGGGAAFVMLQRAGVAPVPAILLVTLALVLAAFAVARWIEPPLRGAMDALVRFSRALGRDSLRSASLPTG